MSKYIVFHASHISRIKNGKTKPSGPKEFSTKVANYIVYKYNSPIYKDLLLTVLDTTDLNDYIKAIKFDELKVPSLPFYIVKSKNYYGI